MFGFKGKEQKSCSCDKKSLTELEKNGAEQEMEEIKKDKISQESISSCFNELASVKEQYVRLVADFQNYKKRVEKDRAEWIDMAKKELLIGLLTLVDNFDRALLEARHTTNDQVKEWLVGFELIHKVLYDFLKEQQVEPILQNDVFDPAVHEAIAQVEAEGKESGSIIDLFEKGFTYRGKLLRPAKVTVAK